ncbi:MAG: glycosyltransferase [Rhodothermales bacterium]
MNITILTAGTRGDVQPFVALALGLQEAGHRVTLAAEAGFAPLITGHGVPHAPLRADFQALATSEEGRGALGGNPLAILRALRTSVLPSARALLEDAWAAAQGADVLVCHPKTLAGPHLAEKLDVPCFLALPVPSLVPTQAFPAPGVATRDLGGFLNRLTYSLTQAAVFPFHGLINRWRRETLDLAPQPLFTDPFALGEKPLPVLYGFSPHVVPPPLDWPGHVHVTGYWFLDEPAWTPPPDLVRFLEAGPPPVYVGFGSMARQDPNHTTAIVLEALARTGQRGIVATGWGGLEGRSSSPDVFVTDGAPHSWLFPRVSVVVHHGGAGTTAAGLRAGKPTVICPFAADQPFWGQRTSALDVGPKPMLASRLRAEALADALHQAAHDPFFEQRASEVGEALRLEDGVSRAVAVLERAVLEQSGALR